MRIAEVSSITNLSLDTLRYYEKIGIISPVSKDTSGKRDYSDSDLSMINFVKCMKATGLSLEDIKYYVDLSKEGDSTKSERLKILINQRDELLVKMSELQENLNYLNVKIDMYK